MSGNNSGSIIGKSVFTDLGNLNSPTGGICLNEMEVTA